MDDKITDKAKVLDNEFQLKDGDDYYPKDFSKKIRISKVDKAPSTRMFDLCLYYLEGRQYLVYDRNLTRFTAIKSQRGRNRIVINLILNLFRSVVARLVTTYPNISVLPASPNYDDVIKAQASEVALRYYWSQENIKEVLQKAIEWLVSCGNVALHTYYDPDKKKVRTDAISPYDLYFEKGSTSLEESDWVAIRSFVKKSTLMQTYPKHKDEIDASAAASGDYTTTKDGETASYSVPPNRVEVYDVYWKDGRYAIMTNNTYLFKGEYPEGCFPIQHIRYTELPNRLWGLGLVQPLIDLQNSYNKFRNQILDNVELMSNPKWLIPKSSGVSAQAITNQAGEKVYYNPAGGKPEQVAGEPIPAYVIDNIQRVQAEMFDVSGIHSVSIGKRAVGIVSGKGIEALQQGDASQLQLTQQSIENAVKKMAETVLVLMKNYYTEATYMRMLDQSGQAVFQEIHSETIVDFPEVFIEANSLFRDELPDRDAKVIEMLQLGLIKPDEALKEISFKTGGMTNIVQSMSDMAHAQKMLNAVIQGHEIEIYSSDNLNSFKKVFGDFMKTDNFIRLPLTIQDYISDIFDAVGSYGQPPEALVQAKRNKVFPVIPQSADDASQTLTALKSPAAGAQTLQEIGNIRQDEIAQGAAKALVQSTDVKQSGAEGITNYGKAGVNPRMGGVGG
jgi:phosphoribosylformylglycinamidine (FGAM) synthase PurS component